MIFHDYGDGGTVLLLLNGFPNNGNLWRKQVERFSRQARVIVAEWTATASPTPFEDAVVAVTAKVRELEARAIYLVGHDLGCFVASEVSRQLPRRIAGQFFVNGAGIEQFAYRWETSPAQRRRSTYVKLLQLPLFPRLVSGNFRHAVKHLVYRMGGVAKDSPLRDEAYVDFRAIESYREINRRVLERTGQPGPRTEVPTTIIFGEQDPFLVPPTGDELAASYERFQCRGIDGGHWLPFTHSRPVNDAILSQVAGSQI